MEDRELLLLAARAALGRTSIPDQPEQLVEKGWNPLEDDSAAMRLAVRLHMSVTRLAAETVVTVDHVPIPVCIIEPFRAVDQGEYEGTRRAIVRAAAAIAQPTPTGASA